MSAITDSSRIKLNIGGVHFETTYNTLKQSSMFGSWLSRWVHNDEDFFVDRSGAIFEHILNFLRNPDYAYPEEHLGELEYYGVSTRPTNIIFINSQLECYRKALKSLGVFCRAKLCFNKNNSKIFSYCYECQLIKPVDRDIKVGDIVIYDQNYTKVLHTGPFRKAAYGPIVCDHQSRSCYINHIFGYCLIYKVEAGMVSKETIAVENKFLTLIEETERNDLL